ncbi:sigma-54-dependent transcriptional regulator [Mangrovibacterium diazotrophicum]|uniref:Two-component system response regulator HydG n=1 Tax=Mangrovibacterium diazotrophicum TaxID=1261403 RepID=A0A419VXB5_9BACT|nr:sigma-54 dependent transcriptional regulator [Mangrovibacterium diazotrophicum]RKD87871.1 two-component system response regulator HydG [Mangrovibacterium diazotrophicum]
MNKILIVDDDIAFGQMLQNYLTRNQFKVKILHSPGEVQQHIRKNFYDLVLTDLRMPDFSGMDIIRIIRQESMKTKIIMMTGYADITTAIQSIKQGAYNYIPKPFQPQELMNMIREALSSGLSKTSIKKNPTDNNSLPDFFEGKSKPSKRLNKHIDLVAPTPMSVLILGESGTGKEYVARSIHQKSKRAEQPFVAVDCGAIPKELVASEFFGHVKGSFTGAATDKTGYFESANGGTLFLDEVGNLSYNTQIQLLRALQERKVKPVGSSKEVPVDVRIIAATNEDLKSAQQDGRFREDLYHRLNEFQIDVPSLHERKEDVMAFARFFLDQANAYLSRNVAGFEPDVEAAFERYSWPGNLREMKNVIKRAVLLVPGEQITLNEIPEELYQISGKEDKFTLYSETNEITLIEKALEKADYNKSKAARILKIDRKTLYNKLKLYRIELPEKQNGN